MFVYCFTFFAKHLIIIYRITAAQAAIEEA